jgi:drug/metabolite transporter (DMT)-like permease
MTPTPRDWALLFCLGVIWGAAFMSTKLATVDFAPLTIAGVRLGVAAITLSTVMWLRGDRFPGIATARERKFWLAALAVGFLANALPFTTLSWAQRHIDSGLAGVLMAVMPLATLVLAHLYVAEESMTSRSALGFILGFFGIVVLVGPQVLLEIGGSASTLLHQTAVLAGAICYAITTIIARRVPPTPALVIAAGVMAVSAAVMVPLSLWVDRPWTLDVSLRDAACVVYLGLAATALAETVYFRVIATAGATFVSLMNYLIPVVAVVSGIVILSEQPGWHLAAALTLILTGIGISQFRSAASGAGKVHDS